MVRKSERVLKEMLSIGHSFSKVGTPRRFCFPGGSVGKESAYSAKDLGLIPGLGRFPGGGHGNPLQYSCLENSQGQRSLAGYSPLGQKELDMTEQKQEDFG